MTRLAKMFSAPLPRVSKCTTRDAADAVLDMRHKERNRMERK